MGISVPHKCAKFEVKILRAWHILGVVAIFHLGSGQKAPPWNIFFKLGTKLDTISTNTCAKFEHYTTHRKDSMGRVAIYGPGPVVGPPKSPNKNHLTVS